MADSMKPPGETRVTEEPTTPTDDRRETAAYLAPYRAALDRHGAGFRATLWGSRETQLLRFAVMCELAPLDGCTILDVGCGQGDFAVYLHDLGVRFRQFIGVDAMEDMIEQAKGRALERCRFSTADLLRDGSWLNAAGADWITISGTLNTMEEPTAQGLVETCFRAAQQGVIFNFLSNRAHEKWLEKNLAPARRFHTVRWIDWALTLSPNVSFTQDYLEGHDATIVVKH